MKKGNFIQAVSCIFLCCWYLVSIVGLDIHTDHHDNRTYVVSLLSGISCENIHPEDHCACQDCTHDNDCEDESDFLTVTGTAGSLQPVNFVPAATVCPAPVPDIQRLPEAPVPAGCPFKSPPRVLLNSLCVLRV